MKFQNLSVALMLSAGLAIGCEEAKDAATNAADAAQDAAAGAAEKTGDAMESLKTEAAEAGEAMKDAGAQALESGKAKASETVEAGKEKVDEAIEAGKKTIDELTGNVTDHTENAADQAQKIAGEATSTAPDAEGTMSAAGDSAEGVASGLTLDSLKEGMSLDGGQVDGIIEKVKGLIGEKNYDAAGQWISKLEGMQLPDGYADKVSGLKSLLEKAQGAGDMMKGLGI